MPPPTCSGYGFGTSHGAYVTNIVKLRYPDDIIDVYVESGYVLAAIQGTEQVRACALERAAAWQP
jgi:hypothetical protein